MILIHRTTLFLSYTILEECRLHSSQGHFPEGGLYQLFVIINSKPILVYYSAFEFYNS